MSISKAWRRLVAWIESLLYGPPLPLKLHVTVDRPSEVERMTTTLTTTQRTTVRLAKVTDRRGRPAQIDGIPNWSASPSDLLTLEPSEDGLSCRVTPTGPGSGSVTVTADALVGEGVQPISHTEHFSILHALAANLVTAVDEPEEIPEDELPAEEPPVEEPPPTEEPPAEPTEPFNL